MRRNSGMIGALLIAAALVAFAPSASAALATDTTWYMKSGGNASDSNGGGFVQGASGTNYAATDTIHCNVSDLVLVTTTTATSSSCAFGTDSPGNILRINSGTNCTVGYYRIVSVSVVTATLDRAAGTTGCTGGVFRIGGTLLTYPQLNTAMGTSSIQQHAYVKADAAYSISSGVTFNFNIPAGAYADVRGYTSTAPSITSLGDEGQVTVNATGGSITMFTLANNNNAPNMIFANFKLDGNGQAAVVAASMNNNDGIFRNIWANNVNKCFIEGGFNFQGDRLKCTNVSTTNGVGILFSNGGKCSYCTVSDSSTSGVLGFQTGGGYLIYPVCANLTGGTTSDCFAIGTLALGGVLIDHATCYNVTRACFSISHGTGSNNRSLTVTNSIMAKVGSYCFDSTGGITQQPGMWQEDYNGCYQGSGTGTYHNWTAGPHDVTLTVDPFINCASQNCALNNSSGGGSPLRMKGYPGVYLGTGYPDMGAIQHGDPKFRIGPF